MNNRRFTLGALFLLSVVIIAYELYVMRSFSVGSWSNFGALVISTALLGNGIAGTLLTFLVRRVKERAQRWLTWSAILFVPSMAGAHVIGQLIPFNPIFIGSDPMQILWIGAYYVNYGIPFFIGALFIGVTFTSMGDRIHKLYFWNMVGSGVGGFLILALMYLLPPDELILPLVFVGTIAALLAILEAEGGQIVLRPVPLASVLVLAVGSFVMVFLYGDINVSEYKSISYVRQYPDSQLAHHSYSPAGELHVYSSSYFHFAPGLSDNAILQIEQMPRQPFWGLYVDGDGPVGVMGAIGAEEGEYLDYLPMAAPYRILEDPRVLLVNLGGGISVQNALYNEAPRITVVERNPELVELMGEDPAVTSFNGNLLQDPSVTVHVGEPRAYCVHNTDTYDLVEISLIDSIGLSDSGGYAVTENYTYTEEAIADYMNGLTEDGVLSITVWNRLNPPRNVLRLLTTVVESLRMQGVEEPENRIFVYDLFLSTATILVKNSDFDAPEVAKLRDFVDSRSFDLIYYPGIPRRDRELASMLAMYRRFLGADASGSNDQGESEAIASDFNPADLYHLTLLSLFEGNEDQLYRDYVFDVRPMTDRRPYYSGYLKFNRLGMYLDQIRSVSEEWGYLVELGILLQSIIFGLIVILLPLAGRWKELFKRQRGKLGVIVYFASLGLGYMLVEIVLIQKLVFFLSDPIFSTSIVITTMLVISGVGSLVSGMVKLKPQTIVRIAVVGIVASVAFYVFGLPPMMNNLLDASMFARILVSMLVIAPGAFFLGMPFPTGMLALTRSKERLIPWAWGMNGALSVTGATLATILTISFGFHVVLFVAMGVYVVAALTFGANEAT